MRQTQYFYVRENTGVEIEDGNVRDSFTGTAQEVTYLANLFRSRVAGARALLLV